MTHIHTNGDEKKPPGKSIRDVKVKASAMPVYEAEIVDEEELTGKEVVSQGTRDAGAPVEKTEKLSYRIGKMAGAVAAFLGIISDAAGVFRANKRSGGGGGRGRKNGSGMGRGKGRGRRKRNFCQ
ncbi:MAG: hypothetical protein GTO45_28065 [Candidatus Aminicenantes bacterium]|nr:hypothetical protein [Candidatus Aminicenantes bacterium]NIM82656.1 hypothetical protein [Candidatus Aminicenantes bacterium]NIN22026.1 hypothetical protein [Candidatus Aminicenantes bacterium]NIN45786.1 hypothetical protein [Candidatus Aminicenantes bacterium]NIN88624.1 hypothetical protein [Candidatus Aminicenantes bacterium]